MLLVALPPSVSTLAGIRSQRQPSSRLATSSRASPERWIQLILHVLLIQLQSRLLKSSWKAAARTTCWAPVAPVSPYLGSTLVVPRAPVPALVLSRLGLRVRTFWWSTREF